MKNLHSIFQVYYNACHRSFLDVTFITQTCARKLLRRSHVR